MNTIIAILFLIAFVAFWLWVFWAPLCIIYHTIMLAVCAVIWMAITIFEAILCASKAMIRLFSR